MQASHSPDVGGHVILTVLFHCSPFCWHAEAAEVSKVWTRSSAKPRRSFRRPAPRGIECPGIHLPPKSMGIVVAE